MTQSEVMTFGHEAMLVIFWSAGPVMIFGMLVGFLVSTVQAVTQLHEQNVAFCAKLLAMAAAIFIFGPFILAQLSGFLGRTLSNMGQFIR